MKFEVDVSEEELKEAILTQASRNYFSDFMTADRRHVDRTIAEVIREIIYKDKERIVNLIVARASRECGNKAVKKILESLKEDA